MSNFWQRTITGAVFVAVLLGAVLWNKYSFAGLFFVVCILGLREYAILFKDRKYKPSLWGTVVGGGGIATIWTMHFLKIWQNQIGPYETALLLGFLSIPVIAELTNAKKNSARNIGLSLAGIIYINIGVICFESIGITINNKYEASLILGFLIILWSSDTFAYLTGRAFGKTPLAPKISPKKTWEGSIGGAICTMGISYVLFMTMGQLNLMEWFGFALIIIVFGTMGDLIESRFKRVLGVKDSGNILPGHGGILDRFDSLLFAAPFVLVFLRLILIYK